MRTSAMIEMKMKKRYGEENLKTVQALSGDGCFSSQIFRAIIAAPRIVAAPMYTKCKPSAGKAIGTRLYATMIMEVAAISRTDNFSETTTGSIGILAFL